MAQIGYYNDMNYLDFNLLNDVKSITTKKLIGSDNGQEIVFSFKFPLKLYTKGYSILNTIMNFSANIPANTAIYHGDILVIDNVSNKTINKSMCVNCNIENVYLYDLYNTDSIFNVKLRFINNNKNIKNSASIILNNLSIKVRYATNYYPLKKIIIPNEISIKTGEVKHIQTTTIPENYTISKFVQNNNIGKVLWKSNNPLKVDVVNGINPLFETIIIGGMSSGQTDLIVTESYGIEVSNKICHVIIKD